MAVLVLAGGTSGFRLTGSLLRHRPRLGPRLRDLLSTASTTLLPALVTTDGPR
jgi:hypothetical protein